MGPGIPFAVNAVLTGFQSGEEVALTLVFADGSTLEWATVTMNSGGFGSIELEHNTGLDSGLYAVHATGSNGGKDSLSLEVK